MRKKTIRLNVYGSSRVTSATINLGSLNTLRVSWSYGTFPTPHVLLTSCREKKQNSNMNARNSFQTILLKLKQIMLDLYSSRQQNDNYYLLSITKYMKLRFLPYRHHPFQNGEIHNLRQVSWEFYLAMGIFMILIQEESVWRADLQKNFVSFNF